MKVSDIFSLINGMAPIETALSFDNSGILLGDPDGKVTKAVVTLDATFAAVSYAKEIGAELIITHHPIIFSPLKSIVKQSGNIVYECLSNGIAVISMHTNLDVANGGVNDCLANALELQNITTLTDEEGFSFKKGELKNEMSADELALFVKERLGGNVRYTDGKKAIKTVCVCGGSGGSELSIAMNNADAFVTADIKHNLFIEADAKEFSLFDAGHFHTENVVIASLAESLNNKAEGTSFFAFNGKEIKTV